MKKRYIVMGIMSLVIFIMFYTYSLKILNALDAISTTNIKGSDLDENNVIEPIHDHELLFLLAGVDQNDGKNGEHTRTDTLMLIKANVDTGSFDIISIPRDCRIKVNGKLDKVNHAHSYGGIKLTLKSLRDFLGVDIDYYVKIDFDAVVKVVDAIGGVEVDVPVTINEPAETLEDIEEYLRESSVHTGLSAACPVADGKMKVCEIVDNEVLEVIEFILDADQLIHEEEPSPMPTVVQVLEGTIRFSVDGVEHELSAGDVVYMATGARHSGRSVSAARFSLVGLKQGADDV